MVNRRRWLGALITLLALSWIPACAAQDPAAHRDVTPNITSSAGASPSPAAPIAGDDPGRDRRPFRYAVHTLFLDETVARLAAEAGFDTVVQVFPWRDVNPAPGVYQWETIDYMVQTAHAFQLDLVARLDMPPDWAVSSASSGIPFDPAAYAGFVDATADRYRGQILGYIIWNEPNLAAEWSRSGGEGRDHWLSDAGWVADPADYVTVLCTASSRIKTADPRALVVGGGLAPTNEQSRRAQDDRLFLDQMLGAGAAGCFDVLAVHDYGYGLSPEADRDEQDGLNLARILDVRDIMLAHGATHPIWITELGYTVQPGDHPSVSAQHQADYLQGAFARVRREWPWVEMVTVWNLVYGRSPHDEMSGYSLLNPDATPRPAYERMKQYLPGT